MMKQAILSLVTALSSSCGLVTALAADAGPTPETIQAIPDKELRSSPYVIRDRALLMNLDLLRTPEDWLKVPGVKGAWKKMGGFRGKTVLQDTDGDGQFELYGEGYSRDPDRGSFWRRKADGSEVWNTAIRKGSSDNNGVQCQDLEGNGSFEVICLGDHLTIMDAKTGDIRLERNIYKDFVSTPSAKGGPEQLLNYPWRLGRMSDDGEWSIVVADGFSPDGNANYTVRTEPRGGVQVVCYRADGAIRWHYRHKGKFKGGGHEVRVHDLNGDGLDEVVYSANGGLFCLNHDGTERWRHELGNHSDWISISDVTGDKRLNVVVQQGGPTGWFYVVDALSGRILRRIPNRPECEVQNFTAGSFRQALPGQQLAVATINKCMLRLIDLTNGEYLKFPVGAATDEPTLRRWNGLDMYNSAAHDADGDGVNEIFTFTTPKPHWLKAAGKEALPLDAAQALSVGVAAFRGDGTLAQYWNFYTPSGKQTTYRPFNNGKAEIRWGVNEWEMRQFVNPKRRFDVDGNGIEEAYIETEPWILLVEIADLRKVFD